MTWPTFTRADLASATAEAARLAIQSGAIGHPVHLTLRAQEALDQGLSPADIDAATLTYMAEEPIPC